MKISDSFHLLAKPIGPICNLDCTYCFYLEKEKLFPGSKDWKMSDEVLENFIRQYIESQSVPEINFAWQGGEPTLLGVDYFRKAVELQKKYANGKVINNSFQTNGVLIDDEWSEFFAENNFLIGLSIDGPAELHDHYRVYKNQKPSFDKVMQGLGYLKKHNVEFNTLTCINRINSYKPLEVYNFLKEIGSVYMQFIPIIERKAVATVDTDLELISPDYEGSADVTEWSVESKQFGVFLTTIFNEWVRKDVGKHFVQLFEVTLESWFGKTPSLCIFNETCGRAMAIEHNGDVYSCDHFVYPENKLGNIMEASLASLVDSPQEQKFGSDKKDKLPKYCLECDVRFACNGECPKHRFIKTPYGEGGLNYLCAGYKMFFHHVDPYMKLMANELQERRSPALVMEWAKEKDLGFPSLKINRNDDCPCGSGKKFKNCCMKLRN
ncbi:MAG: anaerobic sulfatase-maturation protein [Melioribacteraceae bacterium]